MDRTSYVKKVAFKLFGIELGTLTTTFVEQFDDSTEPIPIIISKKYHDEEFDLDRKSDNGDTAS